MEVAGLVTGIAGLFNFCLEAIERVESYKAAGSDSRQLNARFEVCKLRLREWADSVGIVEGELAADHHDRLDNPEIAKVVKGILFSICEIFGKAEEMQKISYVHSGQADVQSSHWPSLSDTSNKSPFSKSGRTKLQNFRWTMKGKAQFTDQVNMLEALTAALFNTVSPMEAGTQAKHRPLARANTETFSEISDTQRALDLFLEEIRYNTLQKAHQQIDDWLDIQNLDRQYEKYLEDRLEGTCQWIFDNAAYQGWRSATDTTNEAKILWVNGQAGYGKSITCARIFETLLADPGLSCAYLSSTSHVQVGGQPDSVARYWLSQIVRANDAAFDIVLGSMRSGKNIKTASNHQVWGLMKEIVTNINHCTFVIDGFDEYNRLDGQRRSFLRKLKAAVTGTRTNCLIVSRSDVDIELELNKAASEPGKYNIYECRITEADVKDDVQLFSNHVVDTRLPKKEQGFRRQLATDMVSKCEGMFLWIKLHQGQLRGAKSSKALNNLVQSMPKGLNQSYDRNWTEIQNLHPDDHNRAITILRWSTFALRPLTIGELTEALIVDLDTSSTELQTDDLPSDIDDEYIRTEVKELCCSLVEVRSESPETPPEARTVHVIHPSAKEYLVAILPISIVHSPGLLASQQNSQNVYLASICLHYLNFEAIWSSKENLTILHPFVKYAAYSWFVHTQRSGPLIETLNVSLKKFLAPGNRNFLSWIKIYERRNFEQNHTLSARSMYYAARFGLGSVMKCLYSQIPDTLNLTGGPLGTALHSACFDGQQGAIDLLLGWGADVNIIGGRYATALNTAVFRDHNETVSRLISSRADVTISTKSGFTALHFACQNGSMEIATSLIRAGAEVNARDSKSNTPLMEAIYSGYLELSKLLIGRGADIDAVGQDGITPLYLASMNGYLEVTKFLLEQGADVDAGPEAVLIPIHGAIFEEHFEIVKSLLENGADANATAQEGSITPLHKAAANGNLDLTKLLLAHGADVNLRQSDGYTPLHISLLADHDEVQVTILLIENGTDVNTETDDGSTPLLGAVLNGDVAITKLLLDKGADTGTRLEYGLNPLHIAALEGQLEIIRMLVEYGADANAVDEEGFTPVHAAAETGQPESIRLLVEYGAQLDALSHQKITALMAAAEGGHTEAVQVILDLGGDISMTNDEGWSILHFAAATDKRDVSQMLLTYGADVSSRTDFGRTALHVAALSGSATVIPLLLDHGAQINSVNSCHRTPLHEAVAEGHDDSVEILLEHGADLGIIDLYGRSCRDWLLIHGSDIKRFRRWITDDTQTLSHDERLAWLVKSVRSTSTRLLEDGQLCGHRNFYTLGKCLLFLGRLDDASLAFQFAISRAEKNTKYAARDCDFCDSDITESTWFARHVQTLTCAKAVLTMALM